MRIPAARSPNNSPATGAGAFVKVGETPATVVATGTAVVAAPPGDCVDIGAEVGFVVVCVVGFAVVVVVLPEAAVHFAYSVMSPLMPEAKLHSCVHALSVYQPPKV